MGVIVSLEDQLERTAVLTKLQDTARLPANYEAAKRALSQADRVDECKTWADKAQALASYAKQAGDQSLFNYAKRIHTRAIRRAGQLLEEVMPARGANQNIRGGTPPKVTRKSAAEEAGMSADQAKTALTVAKIPEEEFEAKVESEVPPTITALVAETRKQAKKTKEERFREDMEEFIKVHGQAAWDDQQAFQACSQIRGKISLLCEEIEKAPPMDRLIKTGHLKIQAAQARMIVQFLKDAGVAAFINGG